MKTSHLTSEVTAPKRPHTDASKQRPSARFHHTSANEWINNWAHPDSHLHPQKSTASIINTEHNNYIATLDLTQAFDHLQPTVAKNTMLHLGLRTTIANLLQTMWGQQARYLTYYNHIITTPTYVNSSAPQGDSWSMLALRARLQITTLRPQPAMASIQTIRVRRQPRMEITWHQRSTSCQPMLAHLNHRNRPTRKPREGTILDGRQPFQKAVASPNNGQQL